MKIGCYVGSYTYNIGNAFFDLGMEYLLKTAFPQATLYPMGGAVRYLFNHNQTGKRLASNSFEIGEVADIDILAYAGMSICDEFISDNGPTFINAAARGVGILAVGAGAFRYTTEEANKYIRFAERFAKYALITRDPDTFSMFNGRLEHVYNGIDCAFSLARAYTPPKLFLGKFDVANFDAGSVPVDLPQSNKNIVYTHHKFSGDIREEFFSKTWTLISDIPYDYLTLYANCSTVYSDRVHACVAALSYGNRAMLFNSTPRKTLFTNLGLEGISSHPCTIEKTVLDKALDRQIELIRQAVNDIL